MDVHELATTKNSLGKAIKAGFAALELPCEVSKNVTTKLRLEANLRSGADLVIACATVKGRRRPGSFALYWLFTLSGGFIYESMQACGLSAHPNLQTPLLFSCTSHNLASATHFEVSPRSDLDGIATAICADIRAQAFPIIEGFETAPERVLDYILRRGPGVVRNPFTLSIILMHLAKRSDRLDEILNVASSTWGFYDFRGEREARSHVVEPVARLFAIGTR